MTAATGISAGTELTSRRTVTAEDVAAVARITGDEGMHHVSGLAGRQVAQGLLTVAFAPLLRTEGGFRLESARVTFLAPVFVGDTVACTVTVDRRDGDTVGFALRIRNQDDTEVAVGEGTGRLAGQPEAGGGAGRLLTADVLADPYPAYRELRETSPVHWSDELHGWVMTGYDHVYGALRDHGRFSSDRIDRLLGSRVPPEALKVIAPFVALASRWMWMVDPPDHTKVRRVFNHGFTPRAVRRLRPLIEETVGDLLDAVADRGSMDLIADFAYPLPAMVLADVYGIPRADAPLLKQWSDAMKVFIGGTPDLAAMAGPAADSMREMMAYFTAVIAERRRSPHDDLVSALVHADEDGPLDPDSLCANLVLVLAASYATTQDMIGNGMLALLRQRAEWHRLQAEPALLPGAIDEVLRYDGPVQLTHRVATEDIALHGTRIAKGDLVYLIRASANRDPARFPDPDRVDVRRQDTGHVAFGAGIHYCIGAALARVEGVATLQALLRRMPGIELDPAAPAAYRADSLQFRGLRTLPVVFPTAAAA
ncbi:MAG: cytochrome P450 [Mycobacteriales bacterium]